MRIRIFIVGSLFLSNLYTLAGTMSDTSVLEKVDNPWSLELGLGYYNFYQGSKSSTITVSAIETDTLNQTSNKQFPLVFASLRKAVKQFNWGSVLFGPSFYYRKAKFEGDVYQFGLANLNNFDYTMKSDVLNLLLEAKFVFTRTMANFNPFLILGLGGSHTNLSYTDKAKPGIPENGQVSTGNNASLNFAYDIGGGVSYAWSNNLVANISYLYLGQQTISTNPYSLNSNYINGIDASLKSHNLLLSLTYHFA